jgi:hypothetical protein
MVLLATLATIIADDSDSNSSDSNMISTPRGWVPLSWYVQRHDTLPSETTGGRHETSPPAISAIGSVRRPRCRQSRRSRGRKSSKQVKVLRVRNEAEADSSVPKSSSQPRLRK